MNNSQQYTANALLSVMKYYGVDMTDAQYEDIMDCVDDLPMAEQEKFLDLHRTVFDMECSTCKKTFNDSSNLAHIEYTEDCIDCIQYGMDHGPMYVCDDTEVVPF